MERKMKRYDYSFLKEKHMNDVLRLCKAIADVNAREEMNKQQDPGIFESLRGKAVIDSVVGSNAIEGIGTSEKRLKEILNNGGVPLTHDEIEILGYKDALNLIHTEYDELEISEALIRQLHYLIERNTGAEDAGQYKKADNYIMEFRSDGSGSIRFTPVSYKEVPASMEQLLLAYYSARQDDQIDQLLLSLCFVLDFLCIHPFRDGNGRVSRLLMLLLLYKAGYDIGRYVSVEKNINEHREQYYRCLKESSEGWHDNMNDYSPFIVFSLQILYRCYLTLTDTLGELSVKKVKKNQRIEMTVLNSIVPVSKARIKEKLPDVSIRTIESELRKLLASGKIVKIGNYKDARYMRADQ